MTAIREHMQNEIGQTILVVDDDRVFRAQLAKALQRRGFQVFEAADSVAALQALSDIKCDLAVLDLKLEQESGLEILKLLKYKSPHTKVLILTGYGTIATAVEALKLGAVNYVTKPANADQILAAFNENLITRKTNVAAPSLEAPSLDQVEWDYIQRVIAEQSGNLTRAAKVLGLHRRSLQRKIAKYPPRCK